MKKLKKIFKTLCIVFILYTLLGFILVPILLKQQLEKQLTAQLQLDTTIESIYFNPLTLVLELNNVNTKINNQPLMNFQQLHVDFALLRSIHKRHLGFKLVKLSTPKLFVYLNEDGSTNFDAFMKKPEKEKEIKEEKESKPINFKISKTQLKNANIDIIITQNKKPTKLEFKQLNYTFYDLGTFKNILASHTLKTQINQKTTLDIKGGFRLNPLAIYGNIHLNHLNITDFKHLIESKLNGNLSQGEISVKFGYNLKLTPSLNLSINDGYITFNDLLLEQNKKETVKVKQIKINDIHANYPKQTLRIKEIQIIKPSLKALNSKEGVLNLSTLAKNSPNTEIVAQEEKPKTNKPWNTYIKMVNLKSGQISFEDKKEFHNININHINVNLNKTQHKNSKLSLNKGNINIGNIYIQDIKNNAHLKVQNSAVNVKELSQQKESFRINNILLKQNKTLIHNDNVNIEAKKLNLNINKLALKNENISIHSVFMKEPNIQVLLKKTNQTKNKKTATKENVQIQQESMNLHIGPFKIKNAKLTFEDENLPIPFKSEVSKLNGQFSQFISQSALPTKLTLEGKVNQYGYSKITGFVNHENIKQLTDVSMIFKNIAIKDLSAYSGKFVGRAFKGGKLNLNLKYNILRSNLDAKNSIIIQDIQLGDKINSKEAMNVPLELGIALLEDSDGKIDLQIPITGNLDNPEFKIAPVVWKALGNMIIKAVSAPFRFLASLLGIEEEKIKSVDFAFGEYALLHSEKETLDHLIQLTQKRPNILLTLTPSYHQIKDTQALQKIKFDEYVQKNISKYKGKDAYVKLLENAYQVLYPKVKLNQEAKKEKDLYLRTLEEKIMQKQMVSQEDLIALAKKRVKSIQTYFKSKEVNTTNFSYENKIKEEKEKQTQWSIMPITISVKK